jgi:hypothetical protein
MPLIKTGFARFFISNKQDKHDFKYLLKVYY